MSGPGASQLRKETAILHKVSYHLNVVQFFGACLAEPAMLVMELMAVRNKPFRLNPGSILNVIMWAFRAFVSGNGPFFTIWEVLSVY